MRRVFWSTVRYWRNSEAILCHITLLEPENAKASLKPYGDGVMSVTVEDFSTLAFKNPEAFLDCTENEKRRTDSTGLFLMHAIYQR